MVSGEDVLMALIKDVFIFSNFAGGTG
jgi:hypothetical protein